MIPGSLLPSLDILSIYIEALIVGKELLTFMGLFYSLKGILSLYTLLDCYLAFVLLKEIGLPNKLDPNVL